MTLALSTTTRNAALDSITTAAGTSALLKIYNGVRPASGGTITTLLVTLTCSASAFAAASSAGVLTMNAITSGVVASTGTATWFRITSSGGTFVIDGDVGTSGSDLNVANTSFVATGTVSVSSGVFTAGNA